MVETVILLHGIARSPRSLTRLEKRLIKNGFQTLNLAYPSQKMDVPRLAEFVADALGRHGLCDQDTKLHFVTHSMGSVVIAYMLGKLRAHIPVGSIGRVVMMGPPLRGSEVADALSAFAPYRWFYGPAGLDLKTDSRILEGIEPDYELGVIAGTRGWPYLSGAFIPGKHDGRVSVARTQCSGVTEHIVLSVTHTLMPDNPIVQRQVLHFLKTGMFQRP